MKKVITFSLWGNNPTYNVGAIKNAELAKTMYPYFECWFYIHIESVPQETIDKLSSLNNVKIILKEGNLSICKPMMWRFEAIDDPEVEIMMSRDTDSRFLLREKLAVEQWLLSEKTFHIMRDHPHHTFTILGGMFGTKKIPSIDNWALIMKDYQQIYDKGYDQSFLNEFIYPSIRNDVIIHANFHKIENEECRPFPIAYCSEFKFVGEYVYADESRSLYHINELKAGNLGSPATPPF